LGFAHVASGGFAEEGGGDNEEADDCGHVPAECYNKTVGEQNVTIKHWGKTTQHDSLGNHVVDDAQEETELHGDTQLPSQPAEARANNLMLTALTLQYSVTTEKRRGF
jgi:hypothetical protein